MSERWARFMNSPYGALRRGSLVIENGTELRLRTIPVTGDGAYVSTLIDPDTLLLVPEHWLSRERPSPTGDRET